MPKGVYERDLEFRAQLRAKQLITHRGRKASGETKIKMSIARRGRFKPLEWRRKMSGRGNGRAIHCATRTPTWWSWVAMKTRCKNPNSSKYPIYGGRGVLICERWDTFVNFLADMGERPMGKTLDRIDNDGHYEPSNCRWATPKQQANNKRKRKA